MGSAWNIAEINLALADRMRELARDLIGTDATTKGRDELRFGRRGSLSIEVAGPKRGSWYDHEAALGGDPLGLVAHLNRTSMRDAYTWAQGWLGQDHGAAYRQDARRPVEASEAPPDPDARKRWSLKTAQALWHEAGDATDTPIEAYLGTRGLTLPHDAPLRFHPRAWRANRNGPAGPAMVAQMTVPETSEPCGVHVTYLRPDGLGKADGEDQKVMLGHVGVIRLVPDEDVTHGLGLAEGIETALAVMQQGGWRPVWAATSAGAVRRFPVLLGIETLTLFADTDGPGLAAARECGQRWAAAGRDARLLAPPAGDWHDALSLGGEAA
ncbi:DUF7146 domain-containing protein [Falsiroseomonas sp. HC035]|uniref:DUF7146 domain-containing protein n=1 Tax=Falsiroseomonas sp. HC035 TaxID=3390999 RepID=UPI003D3154A6